MQDKILTKLSPDRFLFELYEPNYCRLNMSYKIFPANVKTGEEELIEALNEKAIGFCDGKSLFVRPRNDSYAIMCEDEDGKFWFHVDKHILDNFQIASDYVEARHEQFMKPVNEILKKL